MQLLVMIPIAQEISAFLAGRDTQWGARVESEIGRLPVTQYPALNLTVAAGGLGKVQFGVQTQHLLDAGPGWDVVFCAGAAGALADGINIGDVVIGTETVEHDIKNQFGKPRMPRFSGDSAAIQALRRIAPAHTAFHTHFGPIASGDEDISNWKRRRSLRQQTGALAVAWEGAGGAKACHFSRVPYLEIRGVTDGANENAAADFKANLSAAMRNVATLIFSWVREVGS